MKKRTMKNSRRMKALSLVLSLGFGVVMSAVYAVDEGDSTREVELANARLQLEHAKAALYEARKTLALLMDEQGSESSERGFLGFYIMPAPKYGVRVVRTLPGAAAAKAGILSGDLIVAINGRHLPDSLARDTVLHDTYDTLSLVRPGEKVRMKVRRGDRRFETVLTAGVRQGEMYCDGDDGCRPFGHEPAVPYTGSAELLGTIEPNLDLLVPGIDADVDRATKVLPFMEHYGRLSRGLPKQVVKGLELAELNRGLGRYFGASRGVLVVDVKADGIPGIERGDVILSCGDRVVTSPRQIMHMLMNYEQGDPVQITLMRDQQLKDISINLPQSVVGFP